MPPINYLENACQLRDNIDERSESKMAAVHHIELVSVLYKQNSEVERTNPHHELKEFQC